jgi:hypothetical protein
MDQFASAVQHHLVVDRRRGTTGCDHADTLLDQHSSRSSEERSEHHAGRSQGTAAATARFADSLGWRSDRSSVALGAVHILGTTGLDTTEHRSDHSIEEQVAAVRNRGTPGMESVGILECRCSSEELRYKGQQQLEHHQVVRSFGTTATEYLGMLEQR